MKEISHLPSPVAEDWEWQVKGSCRGADATEFFHPENERGSSRRRREAQAKRFCAQCPVTRRCLDFALASREPYGIWGGKSVTERDEILHRAPSSAIPEPVNALVSGAGR